MKKIVNLVIILHVYAVSSLMAHTHTVKNMTYGTILARCWSDVGQKGQAYIKPGQEVSINVGIYCIHTVTVQGTAEPISGLSTEVKIPWSRNRCASHSYLVTHENAQRVMKTQAGGNTNTTVVYAGQNSNSPPAAASSEDAPDTSEYYYKLPYALQGGNLQMIQTDQ